MEEENVIKVGDYVIVQRQNYTKLHKLKAHGNVTMGSSEIELDNIINEKYGDTFIITKSALGKRHNYLEKVDAVDSVASINIGKSGQDNRNITDDGQSQSLTSEEIERLKSEESNANNIVEKLISNSKSFNSKTEYSQEKYMKKKEKKYYRYIQIRRPTIRLLASMFYRQDATKVLGMRVDDLSQILSYANIQQDGTILLYDSGTSGLLPAAIMNSVGANTSGSLIHMHPGNECQKTAFTAMKFPQEQDERCINVNIYSVLRCYYQQKDSYNDEPEAKRLKIEEETSGKKPGWQKENVRACRLLESGVDALIVASKEHPVTIVNELATFVKGGRNIVVFSSCREPLQDLYNHLKEKIDFIYIKIVSNFMRYYQVLPDRTRPDMGMGNGGYILTAFKLQAR